MTSQRDDRHPTEINHGTCGLGGSDLIYSSVTVEFIQNSALAPLFLNYEILLAFFFFGAEMKFFIAVFSFGAEFLFFVASAFGLAKMRILPLMILRIENFPKKLLSAIIITFLTNLCSQ